MDAIGGAEMMSAVLNKLAPPCSIDWVVRPSLMPAVKALKNIAYPVQHPMS